MPTEEWVSKLVSVRLASWLARGTGRQTILATCDAVVALAAAAECELHRVSAMAISTHFSKLVNQ